MKNHQKTAKYCLDLQNIEVENSYECKNCETNFTRKGNLKTHMKTCKMTIINKKLKSKHKKELKEQKEEYEKKLREQEEKYEKKLKDLQDRLENLATKAIEKPTTSTKNTNILNLAPFDMNDFTKRIEEVIMTNMDENHIIEGQAGIARLLAGCFKTSDGQSLVTCTDTSRGIWKHKDIKGNIIKDYRASRIARVIHPIAIKRTDGIITEYDIKDKNTKRIKDLQRRIKEYSKDYVEEEDFAECLKGKKENPQYIRAIERMKKLDSDIQLFDGEIQEIMSSGLYDKNHILSGDIRHKLYRGKTEIYDLKEDSLSFSKNLLNYV